MTRRAAKVDANQGEIVSALRDIPGVTVHITSAAGAGFPDLTVGWRGQTFLLEVKDGRKPPSKQKLTPDQVEWHGTWTGHASVVRNPIEALEAIGIPFRGSIS
jgi:hypothetical protein